MITFPSMDREERKAANELIARLLSEELQDLDAEELLESRCPPWKLLEARDDCAQALRELRLMAEDVYEHRLTALHEVLLYRSVRAWWEHAADSAESDSPLDKNWALHLELEELLDGGFGEWQFDQAEFYANAILREENPEPDKVAAACRLLTLMPRDIRRAISSKLQTLGYLPPGPS